MNKRQAQALLELIADLYLLVSQSEPIPVEEVEDEQFSE